MAMERKRVPLKVIARSIILLLVKQESPETQLPKMVTSRKKMTISAILIATTLIIMLI